MAVLDVGLLEESQNRYLTYALSVVSGRALPDVRDGLKPVQRRILYAMYNNLHLTPDKHFRKSAAVVGEVLARYHPHGDSACYDAMVRMAQDFSLRYPLVDGQGNFGSLDGDSAAAYRYTEARLTALALEVIGDIGQNTIAERDNFDQTVTEPCVLPSRVPNLLMNGASGIAVGMATSIPPHNLNELVKALLLLLENEATTDTKLLNTIKGPDFPTGCQILNTRKELTDIYSTGKGNIRMQGDYMLEKAGRGKQHIVITSVPYGIDKSVLVEKIADSIIAKKVPQLIDVRDESTEVVRIVLELAPGSDPKKGMAYLYKNTNLQANFNVNLTALIPTKNPLSGKPVRLSLREMLLHFIGFRLDVTRRKLQYEKGKLEERLHLLEGLIVIIDKLDESIKIVRKSSGRSDAAKALMKRFKLTELQAFFVVDLRIYQLSKTSIEEVTKELAEKNARVEEISKILKSKKALNKLTADDLKRVAEEYGDIRRCSVVSDFTEEEFDAEDYIKHEDVCAIVTRDGWLKRIKQANDPETTRIREGDSIFYAKECSTRDSLALFTNHGNVFILRTFDLLHTTGFGEPVQKRFKFGDDEHIISCLLIPHEDEESKEPLLSEELLLFTKKGMGLRLSTSILTDTKKSGKRIARLKENDELRGVHQIDNKLLLAVSEQGYALCFLINEIPLLSGPGRGVALQKLPKEDTLISACPVAKKSKLKFDVKGKGLRDMEVSKMTISNRAKRGLKLIKRGLPVTALIERKP